MSKDIGPVRQELKAKGRDQAKFLIKKKDGEVRIAKKLNN